MIVKDKILQTVTAVLGGIIGFMYGDINGILWALISFMVLDYATGVLVGISNKSLSSVVGFRGLAKKIMILAMVAVGHILDTQVIGSGAFVMSAVECFYIANEGISILENTGNLGLPLPKKLKDILIQLKSESEDKND